MTGLPSARRRGPIGPSPSASRRLPRPFADGLEVGAGAERAAGAVQDGDGRVVVGVEGAEGVGERLRGRAVDGVAGLGPVEDDRRDGPPALHADHAADATGLGPRAAGAGTRLLAAPGASRRPPGPGVLARLGHRLRERLLRGRGDGLVAAGKSGRPSTSAGPAVRSIAPAQHGHAVRLAASAGAKRSRQRVQRAWPAARGARRTRSSPLVRHGRSARPRARR